MSNYQDLLPVKITIDNFDNDDGQESIIIRDVLGDPDERAFHISSDTYVSKLITKEHSDPEKYNKILGEWLKVHN
tara:strand:+ start:2159 stop:2383 length:225 start_codon:yes stop_codon:yes gene_type:complete